MRPRKPRHLSAMHRGSKLLSKPLHSAEHPHRREVTYMRFLSAAFILALFSLVETKAANPPSIDDIASALESSADAMGAYQVKIRTDSKSHPAHGEKAHETWQESEFYVGSEGRFRVERKGTIASTASPKPVPECRISAFDGKIARTMAGGTNFNNGKVGSVSVMSKGTDPRNYLFQFMSKPFLESLREDRDRFENPRWAERNEKTVIELTSKPVVRENGVAFRARHLFDKEKGMFPVYRSAEVRLPSFDQKWRVYSETSIDKWIQKDDCWLPQKATDRSYFALADSLEKRNAFPLFTERRVSFSDWQLNMEFGDAVFQLQFLPGIRVFDKFQGKTYTVSSKADQP